MQTASGRAGPASRAISSATRVAPAPSTSVTTTWAPSRASRRATARPIPLAAPVTRAIRRASSFSGGACWSLYSSRGQNSTSKASPAVSDTYRPIPDAARRTQAVWW